MRYLAVATALFCVGGCTTNPITGREQLVDIPAVQAHADVGYALSKSAKRIAETEAQMNRCDRKCETRGKQFAHRVAAAGQKLETAARDMSPDVFERIGAFQVGVDSDLGVSTASSASGRIALGEGLAELEPDDEVISFLIAREMAHVIARHDEEDSGARIFFSAVTALLPVAMIARLVASALGSGAMMGSWAADQRREADEIALALMVRTGRSVAEVSASLSGGFKTAALPDDEWATRFKESAVRVAAVSDKGPKSANFEHWLAGQSVKSIERFSACNRETNGGQSEQAVLEKRRECAGGPA